MNALRFELSKVEIPAVRQRMVNLLTQVDQGLAEKVAEALGITATEPEKPINRSIPADASQEDYESQKLPPVIDRSEALSMKNTVKDSIETRRIAILAADGTDEKAVEAMKALLGKEGAMVKVIAPKLGSVKGSGGGAIIVDESFLIAASVVYDAVFIPGGKDGVSLLSGEADALHFISQAYKHCKAIAASEESKEILKKAFIDLTIKDEGIIIGNDPGKAFVKAIAKHRFWDREMARKVPA